MNRQRIKIEYKRKRKKYTVLFTEYFHYNIKYIRSYYNPVAEIISKIIDHVLYNAAGTKLYKKLYSFLYRLRNTVKYIKNKNK